MSGFKAKCFTSLLKLSKLTAQYPNRDNSKGINHPLVVEETVNERLKILMSELNLSIASFANALGVKDSTIRNYFEEGRQSKPGYDFFERLNRSFGIVNMSWLFGGGGHPLLSVTEEQRIEYLTSKKNSGNIIGTNHGNATVNHLSDCEKDLKAAQNEIVLLNKQLALQEKLIRVYESQQSKP